MPAIRFFKEEVKFRLPPYQTTTAWISKVIRKEGFRLRQINFVFCSDEYLRSINIEYLRHSTFTDIITFDNSEVEQEIEGDIFISIDRVTENARTFNQSFTRELQRVMIHGVLHLMGHSDKGAKNVLNMRNKENTYLSLLAKRST